MRVSEDFFLCTRFGVDVPGGETIYLRHAWTIGDRHRLLTFAVDPETKESRKVLVVGEWADKDEPARLETPVDVWSSFFADKTGVYQYRQLVHPKGKSRFTSVHRLNAVRRMQNEMV